MSKRTWVPGGALLRALWLVVCVGLVVRLAEAQHVAAALFCGSVLLRARGLRRRVPDAPMPGAVEL